MICGSGPSMILKIGDFGISKFLALGSIADTVVGTPSYLSPELCEGKIYNEKSDIWALGCILYEIAKLRKMFEGSSLPMIVMKIMKGKYTPLPDPYSDGLRDLVASCVQLDPDKRSNTTSLMGSLFLQDSTIDTQFSVGRLFPEEDSILVN